MIKDQKKHEKGAMKMTKFILLNILEIIWLSVKETGVTEE